MALLLAFYCCWSCRPWGFGEKTHRLALHVELEAIRLDNMRPAGRWRFRNGDPGEKRRKLLRTQTAAQEPDCADGPAGVVITPTRTSMLLTYHPCTKCSSTSVVSNVLHMIKTGQAHILISSCLYIPHLEAHTGGILLQEHVKREKQVMAECDCPFMVSSP